MSKLNKGLFSSKDQTWETPIDFFNKLDSIFKFELDVAASDDNHKCDRYYTEETDGLAQDWEGVCWMNPPYGRHQIKWIEKASEEANKGATVVCLIPARPDTKVWHNIIFPKASCIAFIKGRLKFGGSKDAAPFPSALIVFGDITKEQEEALREFGAVIKK